MYFFKSIRFVPVIALVVQGLFFSFGFAENPETEIVTAREKSRCGQGIQYLEKGLIDLAIPELKRAVEFYPDDIEAHTYLGLAYSQKGLIPDAVDAFQKALQMNHCLQRAPFAFSMVKTIPAVVKEFTKSFGDMIHWIDGFSEAHELLGLCYVLQGRLSDALNEYNKALTLESNYRRETASAIDQAVNEYEEVLKVKPDCVDAYLKLACAHAGKGMLDTSIADMKRAISIAPDRVETHVYLSCFYAKKWMMGEALKELSAARKAQDTILEKLLTEGERCIGNCMFDEAISTAGEALKVDRENEKAFLLLAIAYSKKGEMDKAIEICKEVIHLYPNDIRPYTLLGWIYVQSDLLEEAADLAERAICRDPENAEARTLMACIYTARNRLPEAIAMCNKVTDKTSVEKDIIGNYGWIRGKVSSIEQKFREVMDVLEMKTDYAEGYLCLGWLHSKNGELEKAIAAFEKAIELSPDSSDAHRYLGNMYVQKGEIKAALNEYQKALEILSKKAQDEVRQGLAYFQKGNIEQAIDCFNDVLKSNPNNEEAYVFLADAYEKKGLYSAGIALRLEGERLKNRGGVTDEAP